MDSSDQAKITSKVIGLDDRNMLSSIVHVQCQYCGKRMDQLEYDGSHKENCAREQELRNIDEKALPPNASRPKETELWRYQPRDTKTAKRKKIKSQSGSPPTRDTKTAKRKKNKSQSGTPPKELICPFCEGTVAETNWKQHLHEKHKRESKTNPSIKCPICSTVVLLNIYPQHAKTCYLDLPKYPKQSTTSGIVSKDQIQDTRVSTSFNTASQFTPIEGSKETVRCTLCGSEVRKNQRETHLKKRHPETTSRNQISKDTPSTLEYEGNQEAFWQSAFEPRDGSKLYAHRYRENGAFGSHPIHDDYGDESSAE